MVSAQNFLYSLGGGTRNDSPVLGGHFLWASLDVEVDVHVVMGTGRDGRLLQCEGNIYLLDFDMLCQQLGQFCDRNLIHNPVHEKDSLGDVSTIDYRPHVHLSLVAMPGRVDIEREAVAADTEDAEAEIGEALPTRKWTDTDDVGVLRGKGNRVTEQFSRFSRRTMLRICG